MTFRWRPSLAGLLTGLLLTVTLTGGVAAGCDAPDTQTRVDERGCDGGPSGGGLLWAGGYDPNENKRCGIANPGWVTDTDGDGTVDCLDNDDDGDMLTDRYEEVFRGYDFQDRDHDGDAPSDGDGIPDSYDIRPDLPGESTWSISARDYNGDGCDIGTKPDPYLGTFKVKLRSTETVDLTIPSGWHRDAHVDNRAAGDVSDLTIDSPSDEPTEVESGEYDLYDDIRQYGTTPEGKAPRLVLVASLIDHDVDNDDTMDLDPDAGETMYRAEVNLMENEDIRENVGDGCRGKLKFSFENSIWRRWVCTAVHHANHPEETIYTDTKLRCR